MHREAETSDAVHLCMVCCVCRLGACQEMLELLHAELTELRQSRPISVGTSQPSFLS